MAKFLISFPSSAMSHLLAEDMPAVSAASHAVVREAKSAGVWVFGGGINESIPTVMVGGDGTVTNNSYPQTKKLDGGFAVFEVATREQALMWAAKLAASCRCAQELREFRYDPES